MAKPLKATPVIKGDDAIRIEREMREGSPKTAERDRIIERADRIFGLLKDSPFLVSKHGFLRR